MAAVLKDRLAGREPLLGTWVNSDSPELVETLGAAGFDVVVLDLEHGEFGPSALPGLLRAAEVTGAHTLVRTSRVDLHEVMRALDVGAEGVIVPNVQAAREVESLVAAAHYAPRGIRGAAPMVRATCYGTMPFAVYRERIERDVVLIPQVEGPAGLAQLDAILAVDGIDAVFVGPFDLSQHLGVPGDTDHPSVVAAMRDLVARAAAEGVATGTWAPSAASARPWLEAGVRLVTVSSSTALFTEAARGLLADLRQA